MASREYYWGCLPDNRYGKMVGTSMAAPTIAAVAALWRQAVRGREDSPVGEDVLKRFRSWLHRVADDVNKNGWDPELGFGTLLLDSDEIANFGQ